MIACPFLDPLSQLLLLFFSSQLAQREHERQIRPDDFQSLRLGSARRERRLGRFLFRAVR